MAEPLPSPPIGWQGVGAVECPCLQSDDYRPRSI
jgi:hypothetical protein